MTDVRVNKSFIAENLSAEDLEQGKGRAKNVLERMNDRQFVDWLVERFPEASTGEVNLGVVTAGNVLYRFRYADVADIIREELISRLALPRITKNMIALPLVGLDGKRSTSLEFMQSALDAYAVTMKDGPEEPKTYTHDDAIGEIINREWIDWYTDMYGVTRNQAWKVAAAKIAKDYGKDPKEFTAVPDTKNRMVVHFVNSIDQISI